MRRSRPGKRAPLDRLEGRETLLEHRPLGVYLGVGHLRRRPRHLEPLVRAQLRRRVDLEGGRECEGPRGGEVVEVELGGRDRVDVGVGERLAHHSAERVVERSPMMYSSPRRCRMSWRGTCPGESREGASLRAGGKRPFDRAASPCRRHLDGEHDLVVGCRLTSVFTVVVSLIRRGYVSAGRTRDGRAAGRNWTRALGCAHTGIQVVEVVRVRGLEPPRAEPTRS